MVMYRVSSRYWEMRPFPLVVSVDVLSRNWYAQDGMFFRMRVPFTVPSWAVTELTT